MRGGAASKHMLAIQAPTWEVNPTVPANEYQKHYVKDAAVFWTEYGGVFTDRTKGWIDKEGDLVACIDPTKVAATNGRTRQPHFIGLDLGLVGDGTAIAIGHITPEGKIVVDLVDRIQAGRGEHADRDRLEFDEVADWILALSKRFYLVEGMFDQWAGIPLEQALVKRGLRQMRAESMTKPKVSEMFRNFKDMMFDNRLVLYDHPIPAGKQHCPYIEELLELQAEYHSKFVTTVEAPNIEGKHDDMSDALIRMVWLASQALGRPKFITTVKVQRGGEGASSHRRRARLKAMAGGSHPDRQIPKGPGGKKW
jgi:hypothetical protein